MNYEPIKWIANDQIEIIDGWAWAISPSGRPYCMGTEKEALETLEEEESDEAHPII